MFYVIDVFGKYGCLLKMFFMNLVISGCCLVKWFFNIMNEDSVDFVVFNVL